MDPLGHIFLELISNAEIGPILRRNIHAQKSIYEMLVALRIRVLRRTKGERMRNERKKQID